MEKCLRAVVSGRVQGVFFRAFTQEEGERLQLAGWVRNLPSGEVETLFCGPEEQVSQMQSWLAEVGSPQSRVDSVRYEEVEGPAPCHGFEIRS